MMLKMRTLETQLAAVPHDVVKDCGVILNLLAYEGFPTAVIDSVNAVTKRTVDGAEEPSEDCIRRAALTRISRAVTLADLEDNIDLSRIERPTKKGDARIDRYKRATKLMEKAVRSAGTRM